MRRGPAPPPLKGLLKQNSWSPDIERDEAWERRRRGIAWRVRSVTDDDLDELRGCIDLGFGFEPSPGCAACGAAGRSRLVETLPALDLYYAVHGGGGGEEVGGVCSCGAASEASSEESPLGSPVSIVSPGVKLASFSPRTTRSRI
jgi:hypothetical protein